MNKRIVRDRIIGRFMALTLFGVGFTFCARTGTTVMHLGAAPRPQVVCPSMSCDGHHSSGQGGGGGTIKVGPN